MMQAPRILTKREIFDEEMALATHHVSRDTLVIHDDDYNPKLEMRQYLRRYIEGNLEFITTTIANKILLEATETPANYDCATISQFHVREDIICSGTT